MPGTIIREDKRETPVSSMAVLFPYPCDTLGARIESGGQLDFLNSNTLLGEALVLDCRPFLAYADSHIRDAVSVHCPAILRRRSGGHLPLRTVIPDDDVRGRLMSGQCQAVLLYEELGSQENEDSMITSVAQCLKTEAGIKHIFLLEGGFQRFQQLYPHLCTRQTSLTAAASIASPAAVKRSLSSPSLQAQRLSRVLTPLSFGPEHDQEQPVEILHYLYLGSAYHASCKDTLERLGITALLNVSQTCPNHFEDSFTYKSIPVEDSGNEDIGAWFNEAIDYVDRVKNDNGKVLVHCHAGISRSATICMAYLMAAKRLRMEEAYEYVKARRRIVSPNFHFMEQLLAFESRVFSPTSLSSPRSPLLALVAASPSGDTVTPSCGAQHNVFNFSLAQEVDRFPSSPSSPCSSPAIFDHSTNAAVCIVSNVPG